VDRDGDFNSHAANAVSVLTLFSALRLLVKSFDIVDRPFAPMATLAPKS
jgi:hypothetical protein